MERIKQIQKLLDAKCYLVGGAVLDYVLKREPKDYDIEVHGLSIDSIISKLKDNHIEADCTGSKFGVVRFKLDDCDIELSVPRKETKCGLKHSDFDIQLFESLSIPEAARRRDFTINAIYLDIETNEFIDPYYGLNDFLNGVLRHVSDETFIEDPLRVFRAAQIHARKTISVAQETISLCTQIVTDGYVLSKDSIFGELNKLLLLADKPSKGFEFLKEINCLPKELSDLIDCPQNPLYHPEGDVWTHTMMVIDEAANLRKHIPITWQLPYMYAMLLHDIGKPSCNRIKDNRIISYNHAEEGAKLAINVMNNWTNSSNLIERTCLLIKEHMNLFNFIKRESKDSSWIKLHNRCPLNILAYVAAADHNGRLVEKDETIIPLFLSKFDSIASSSMDNIKNVLSGEDLIELGLKPGPLFKKLLKYSYKYQINNNCTNKETLKKRILKLLHLKKEELIWRLNDV